MVGLVGGANTQQRNEENTMTFKKYIFIAALFLLSACAGFSDLEKDSKYRATFTVDGHSYDEIWEAALGAFSGDLHTVFEDKASGVVRGRSEVNFSSLSAGESVAVFIILQDAQINRYWIAVVSKARFQPNFTGRDWRFEITQSIKSTLGE